MTVAVISFSDEQEASSRLSAPSTGTLSVPLGDGPSTCDAGTTDLSVEGRESLSFGASAAVLHRRRGGRGVGRRGHCLTTASPVTVAVLSFSDEQEASSRLSAPSTGFFFVAVPLGQ